MEGRWTINKNRVTGASVFGPDVTEWMPVVPCDDAAVERATRAVRAIFLIATDEQAQIAATAVLRAAGETP